MKESGINAICQVFLKVTSRHPDLWMSKVFHLSASQNCCPTALGLGHMEQPINAELRKAQEEDLVFDVLNHE